MEIFKELNGDELTLTPVGRVDTITAPEFDATIKSNISGIKKLILNFEKLVFLSSAGLRVLLSTQKVMKLQGKMVVRNVSPAIMEVFDITGFSSLLNIE